MNRLRWIALSCLATWWPAGDALAAEAAERIRVPAGTELVFEMVDPVNSKTSRRGDRFPLRLVEPLRIEGHLLVPAGALAMGEVVHADRAKAGGQAGELILAARHLEWEGALLPLRSFNAGVGRDRGKPALAVAVAAGPAAFLVRGGEVEIPAGTLVGAKLREAADLPAVPEGATPEPPTLQTTTTGESTE